MCYKYLNLLVSHTKVVSIKRLRLEVVPPSEPERLLRQAVGSLIAGAWNVIHLPTVERIEQSMTLGAHVVPLLRVGVGVVHFINERLAVRTHNERVTAIPRGGVDSEHECVIFSPHTGVVSFDVLLALDVDIFDIVLDNIGDTDNVLVVGSICMQSHATCKFALDALKRFGLVNLKSQESGESIEH